MKHARKLTSLLLALVMVFALAVTVAADETTGTTGTGSITVENPVADKTYTAYKILMSPTLGITILTPLRAVTAKAHGTTLSVPVPPRMA